MDWVAMREKITIFINKYKYVALILIIGLVMMSLPDAPETEAKKDETEQVTVQADITEQLEQILGQIEGVGKVAVFLTESSGAETIFQTDQDSSYGENSQSIRVETVVVSNSNRDESGLVRRVIPPTYQGAIVVCQGADRPSIQLAIVEAVSNAIGISADRISVLKMK